jgi:hypothetical protein
MILKSAPVIYVIFALQSDREVLYDFDVADRIENRYILFFKISNDLTSGFFLYWVSDLGFRNKFLLIPSEFDFLATLFDNWSIS